MCVHFRQAGYEETVFTVNLYSAGLGPDFGVADDTVDQAMTNNYRLSWSYFPCSH